MSMTRKHFPENQVSLSGDLKTIIPFSWENDCSLCSDNDQYISWSWKNKANNSLSQEDICYVVTMTESESESILLIKYVLHKQFFKKNCLGVMAQIMVQKKKIGVDENCTNRNI